MSKGKCMQTTTIRAEYIWQSVLKLNHEFNVNPLKKN